MAEIAPLTGFSLSDPRPVGRVEMGPGHRSDMVLSANVTGRQDM